MNGYGTYYRQYHYDPIGNRKDRTEGTSAGAQKFYCANDRNQYLTLDDASGCPAASPIEEEFAYDTDGNLTSDGTYTYVWDGENRLKEVYPSSPGSSSKKLVFAYDYMGRRVQKQVFGYDTQTSNWEETADTDLKFVYDQWNVSMVLNGKASDAIQSKYTWGLDMSGSLHGAGGIGGLLAWEATSVQNSPSFWYFYDGNGNVGQLVKASDQSIAATYEYDPYGNVIVSSGMYAEVNPFRFSTKWFDDESGLGYWGYRYYSTRLGRWINRDPIEEEGGGNLNAVYSNDLVNGIDVDGRYVIIIGGAGGIGDGDVWSLGNYLRGLESSYYQSQKPCTLGIDNPGNNIRVPTGIAGVVLPDWDRAVGLLKTSIDEYIDYLENKSICDCPEYLHIIGFSDGASTIYKYLKDVGVLPSKEFIGVIGMIDMVRVPGKVGDPTASTNKVEYLNQPSEYSAYFKGEVFIPLSSWPGYSFSGWSGWSIPSTPHVKIPSHAKVWAELDWLMHQSMQKLINTCDCSTK